MRFVYHDPYGLRSAVEQLVGQPVATRERDVPIPVDVYQQGNEIVIEGALPGARLEDLELTCEDGLLTVRGEVTPSFENGIIRIIVPRRGQRVAHTIKVEVGKATDTSRIIMEKPEVVDAVKGKGYREVETKTNRRKTPSK
jgi:HSP20 family molecular chaperone IbpA